VQHNWAQDSAFYKAAAKLGNLELGVFNGGEGLRYFFLFSI
jgi:hypothetical protein